MNITENCLKHNYGIKPQRRYNNHSFASQPHAYVAAYATVERRRDGELADKIRQAGGFWVLNCQGFYLRGWGGGLEGLSPPATPCRSIFQAF